MEGERMTERRRQGVGLRATSGRLRLAMGRRENRPRLACGVPSPSLAAPSSREAPPQRLEGTLGCAGGGQPVPLARDSAAVIKVASGLKKHQRWKQP
eukprot:scaffold1528_cov198-Pinguiococcus_pyrenoidosus.AAC.6